MDSLLLGWPVLSPRSANAQIPGFYNWIPSSDRGNFENNGSKRLVRGFLEGWQNNNSEKENWLVPN